jgi:hypothetical protein
MLMKIFVAGATGALARAKAQLGFNPRPLLWKGSAAFAPKRRLK